MTLSLSFTILIAVLILLLGSLIYFKRPLKGLDNKLFFLLAFSIATWMISNFLENEPVGEKFNILFLRIDFASASLLAYFWFLFCFNFLKPYRHLSKIKNIFLISPAIIFTILSFTNLIIHNISYNKIILFEKGILYHFYSLYILSYIIVGGIGILLKKYRKSENHIEKNQILYIIIGVLISALLAIIINLFLQPLLSIKISRIGIYGIVFMTGFIAYDIFKHHLFNIKIITTEILTFVLWTSILMDALLAQTLKEKVLKIGLLIFAIIIGAFLIYSVNKEIEQREALEEINKKLGEAARFKSSMLSFVSHQIRTPITAIRGFIQLIQEGSYGEIKNDIKKPINYISQSIERLNNLINDFLDSRKIEEGKIEYKFEKINITNILKNIINELQILADKKNLRLIFEDQNKEIKAMADEQELRQVFQNLIDNAIKYTEKGFIKIEISELSDTKEIIIKISDSGMGISNELMLYLFDPFARGKKTDIAIQGTGLGLYIAKEIIQAHQGQIWAESKGEGTGSAFYVKLKKAF